MGQEDEDPFAVPPPVPSPSEENWRAATEAITPMLRRFKSEYCSTRHPDYQVYEDLFALNWTTRGVPERQLDTFGEAEAVKYLAALRDPQQRDGAALKLIEQFGPEVMRPPAQPIAQLRHLVPLGLVGPSETYLREELRHEIWSRVMDCHLAARLGVSDKERRAAARFLINVGKALAGRRRGRPRRAGADPRQVRDFYYRRLFRLDRAVCLWDAWRWPGSDTEKIQLVAEASGLSEDERPVLSRADELKRPLALKERARDWTAREFDVNERIVSNILAPSGVSGSRKPPRVPGKVRRFRDLAKEPGTRGLRPTRARARTEE